MLQAADPVARGPFDDPIDPNRSDFYFSFGERLKYADSLRDSQCNFWELFFFRSPLGPVPAAAR